MHFSLHSIHTNITTQQRGKPFEFQKPNKDKMYPRVKVKVEEEDDDDHFPPPNHSESSAFLRLIESLSKQEKENQMGSPPSIARITKAYVRSPPTKSLSASKDVGTLENSNKQIGKDIESSNPKANSVPPPRAVLSSPDNDGMIGNRNKLYCARSAVASKKLRPTPSEQIKPGGVGQARNKVQLGGNTTQSSPNTRKLRPNTEKCGLAGGRTRKDPLKQVVQKQKTNIGDRTSS